MRLRTQFLTKNECYITADPLKPRGIMVHSTGANNPNVSRYVPGNEELGRNTAGNHWDQFRPGGRQVCVHAFIGKFADGNVGTVQTLPFKTRGWHCAGKGNDTHIGFEICEDNLKDPSYFEDIYKEAVEFTALLCQQYELDPLKDGVVICHQEGYQRKLASNHADVLHWFPKFGKTMDIFRNDVSKTLKGEIDDMSYEQWKAYKEQYDKEIAAKSVSTWAESAMQKAISLGLTDGTRPQSSATRQEVAAMVVKALSV